MYTSEFPQTIQMGSLNINKAKRAYEKAIFHTSFFMKKNKKKAIYKGKKNVDINNK